MSFDERKLIAGQEIVEAVDLYLDQCVYCSTGALNDRYATANVSIDSGSTGQTITITDGSAATFSPDCYALLSTGEIIAVDVVSSTSLLVTGRGRYGTTPQALAGGETIKLMHQGEADGTCYGYAQTCSSADAYTPAPTIKTFPSAPLGPSMIYHNGLITGSIRKDGAMVNPGENIGTRGRLNVTLLDEFDELDLLNPYRDRIAPKGTRFGKLLARHPNMIGRKIVHKEGLRDPGSFEQPDFITRTYVIDDVKLSGGKLQITALDPLIMLEGKKAKVPMVSRGKLPADIDEIMGTLLPFDSPDWEYGNINDEIFVRIDSEVIKCEVTGPTTLTVIERGYNSEVKKHKMGATIQKCLAFINTHYIDAIIFLIQNYTKTPTAHYLYNLDDYADTKALIPAAILSEYIVSKPRAVVDIINELIKYANLVFRWDESGQHIAIEYVPEINVQAVSLNDDNHFKAGSVSVNLNEKEQYSRFLMLWGPDDITKSADENYQVAHYVINATLENERHAGMPNEKKDEKTEVLQNHPDDSLLAVAYCSRVIDGSLDFPKTITAQIDAENVGIVEGGEIAPGRIVNISTHENQTVTGEPLSELYQIKQITGSMRHGYRMTARRFKSLTEGSDVDHVIGPGTYLYYDLSDDYAPVDPGVYVIYADPGAIFGSGSTAVPAFTTGAQAAGVEFKIIMRGKVLAMGGAGGDAGVAHYEDDRKNLAQSGDLGGPWVWRFAAIGSVGMPGGPAMEITVPTILDTGSGLIWGGGGGGAGGTSAGLHSYGIGYPETVNAIEGRGGHGGQGYKSSAGGAAGYVDAEGLSYLQPRTGAPGQRVSQSNAPGAAWGEPGPTPPENEFYEFFNRPVGGAAGPAIITNGNDLQIVSGNNTFNVKGPII